MTDTTQAVRQSDEMLIMRVLDRQKYVDAGTSTASKLARFSSVCEAMGAEAAELAHRLIERNRQWNVAPSDPLG